MSLDCSWHIYCFRRAPGQGARLTIGSSESRGREFILRQSGRWPLAAWGRDPSLDAGPVQIGRQRIIRSMSPGALPTFEITATSQLLRGIHGFGITTFVQLALHVSTIPYGRTTSNSPLAVLVENRGTCSSKHRLLAEVAHEL